MEYGETTKMKSASVDFDAIPAARRGGMSALRYPVYICSGLVGGFLLYRSTGLYEIAFEKWGLGGIANACPQMATTPIIGGLLAGGCGQGAATIAGLIVATVLFTLTIVQSLPTLLYFHPKAISGMVTQLRINRKGRPLLAAESGDTEEIKSLINRHNHLSDRQLRTLLIFSVAAFALEFWIVRTARGTGSTVGAALVDSLGFDVLTIATLAFSGIFRPQATATKTRRYGD